MLWLGLAGESYILGAPLLGVFEDFPESHVNLHSSFLPESKETQFQKSTTIKDMFAKRTFSISNTGQLSQARRDGRHGYKRRATRKSSSSCIYQLSGSDAGSWLTEVCNFL